MTARRITGRAAAMATITVLFAGAAAAAAGGVLPGPFSGGTVDESSPAISVDPSTTGPATSDPLVTDPTSTDPTSTDVTGTDGTTSSLPEAYGLCTAWNSGHEKKADNPAFSKLQHAADEMDGTVDEYCDQVFADKDASRGGDDDDTDSSTPDDTDGDDTESTDVPHDGDHSSEHGSSGSGNGHGHGPKG